MSVKRECEIIIDDDPESGQCSDEETENFKAQKKSRKHKKRAKGSKSRKRKLSDSTTSSTKNEIEFFNPYSVNVDRFSCKPEYYEPPCAPQLPEENHEKYSDLPNDDVDETFNNLYSTNHSEQRLSQPLLNFDSDNHDNPPINSIESEIKLNNLKALYYIDKTGIECTNADLRYYLLDFGFSTSLASDVFSVLYHTPSPEPEPVTVNEEEMEENDDEMFNDLPIIETSANGHEDMYANSYSPEPANKIIEPYNTAKGPPVSYASNFDNSSFKSSLKPLNRIIDPSTIPEVGPRDPRLNVVKQTHLKSQNLIPKNPPPTPEEPLDKGLPKPAESNVVVNKEWEVIVANMVKTHLRLYLVHNDINKEEYKSILKRAVNKIISSGEKKLETDKISKFLHSYVIMMQKSRYVDSI